MENLASLALYPIMTHPLLTNRQLLILGFLEPLEHEP